MTLLLWLACTGITTIPDKDVTVPDSEVGTDTGETAANGEIQVQPSILDFGPVNVGQTSSKDVTITNVGDSGPLSVNLLVKGDTVFEVPTSSVQVEGDTVVTLDFTPSGEKSYNGILKIDAGDAGKVEVDLAGDGVKSEESSLISVNPTSIDFGQVDVGSTASGTVLIENTGAQDLLISDIRYGDSTLSFGGGSITLPQVISSGKNKALTVNFTPAAEKPYNSTVTILSDDPVTPRLEIPTSGEGLHSCSICSPILTVDTGGSDPYGLSFTLVTLFGSSATSTVTLMNDGDQDLDISSVNVSNDFIATCGTFSLKGWNGAKTLAPGRSTSVDVTWKVTGSCLDVEQSSIGMNVMEIQTNDPGANPYLVKLSGTAI